MADKNGFGPEVRRANEDGAFLRQELFLGAEDGDVPRCERAIRGLPCGPNGEPAWYPNVRCPLVTMTKDIINKS